jgi:hypothetical protein
MFSLWVLLIVVLAFGVLFLVAESADQSPGGLFGVAAWMFGLLSMRIGWGGAIVFALSRITLLAIGIGVRRMEFLLNPFFAAAAEIQLETGRKVAPRRSTVLPLPTGSSRSRKRREARGNSSAEQELGKL